MTATRPATAARRLFTAAFGTEVLPILIDELDAQHHPPVADLAHDGQLGELEQHGWRPVTEDGNVIAMVLAEVTVQRDDHGNRTVVPIGDEFELPCELALFAIGFEGVERTELLSELDLAPNGRGALACGSDWQTDVPGVFVCGDAHRGASLVVWAIAEGRAAARGVDEFLMGESDLPSPVHPAALPLSVR